LPIWRVVYRSGSVCEVDADELRLEDRYVMFYRYQLVILTPRRVVALRADPREVASIRRRPLRSSNG
jgi:hypothetical protein